MGGADGIGFQAYEHILSSSLAASFNGLVVQGRKQCHKSFFPSEKKCMKKKKTLRCINGIHKKSDLSC